MIKTIYKISSGGIYEDIYLANLEENVYYNGEEWLEIDFNYVELQPPNAKVMQWVSGNWIVIEDYPIEPISPHEPTDIEILQEENNKLKTRLYETEIATAETSSMQEELIMLLIEMGVI